MSSTANEPIKFADGIYQFGPLSLKQAIELERACGTTDREGILHPKSVYTIYDEIGRGLGLDGETPVYLGGGAAHPSDIRETIRLLLIAGGQGMVAKQEVEVGPIKAAQLCDDYLYPARPMLEGQYLAWAGLKAMIEGVTLKKKAVTPRVPRKPKPSPEA